MKNITHYFRRSSKPDQTSLEKLDEKIDHKLKIFQSREEESYSSEWEYTSEDEVENYSDDRVKKKSHLVVKVPGVTVCLDSTNPCNKRKRKYSVSSKVVPNSITNDAELFLSTPLKVSKREKEEACSFYMSPLRIESDTSPKSPGTMVKAEKCSTPAESLSTKMTISSRRSRRSNTSRRRLNESIKEQDVSVNENLSVRRIINDNSDSAETPDITENLCQKIDEESSKDIKSRMIKDSREGPFINENVFISTKDNEDHSTDKDFSPSVTFGLPLKTCALKIEPDLMTENNCKTTCKSPHKLVHSAFSLIMSGRGNRNTTKDNEFPVGIKKKRSSLNGVADDTEDEPVSVKRRKISSVQQVANVTILDMHNNLYNYFSKAENPKKTKRCKHMIKKVRCVQKEKVLPVLVKIESRTCSPNSSPNKGALADGLHLDSKLTIVKNNSPAYNGNEKRTVTKKMVKQCEKDCAVELKFIERDSSLDKSYTVTDAEKLGELTLNPSIVSKKLQRMSHSLRSNENWTVKEHNGTNLTLCKNVTEKEVGLHQVYKKSHKKHRSNERMLKIKLEGKQEMPKDKKLETENSSTEGIEDSNHDAKMMDLEVKFSKSDGITKSSKLQESTRNKIMLQKSANQVMAAKIVRRACRKVTLKSKLDNTTDINQPSTSSNEVIFLSQEMKKQVPKTIIIKEAYVKLAPLFLAKDEIRRKQVFLHSGTPEILQKKLKQQKRFETEVEEKCGFPKVSHVLQYDQGIFPWNLEQSPSLAQSLSNTVAPLLVQKEVENLTSTRKFYLGIISDLRTPLAFLLLCMRPPTLKDVTPDNSLAFSPYEIDEYVPCFCPGMSYDVPSKSCELTPLDIEKFERIHAWIMRSLLPPGVAFKMNIDLSSFLPAPSLHGFPFDHISVLPSNESSSLQLRKQMLLKLKQEYPGFPVNRWFKIFYQRRKAQGGLYCAHQAILIEKVESVGMKKKRQRTKSANPSNQNVGGEMSSFHCSVLTRSRRKASNDKFSEKSAAVQAVDIASSSVSSSNPSESCHTLKVQPVDDSAMDLFSHAFFSSESWVNVFAPQCYDDACILGRNLKTIDKLKRWLEKWKHRSTIGQEISKSKQGGSSSDTDYSSGSEFLSSNDDDDQSKVGNLPTNVAILIGPCSSGKTSTVYAIAEEIGCKVLEINASSKRTGKHILDSVKEATRSHQVTPCGSKSKSFGSLFENSSRNGSNIPNKLKKNPGKDENYYNENASAAMSVIFVEDVDIVFENKDEGFISALTSLIASSKRPFILEVHTREPLKMGTTNNMLLLEALTKSSPHLTNLLVKQSRSPLLLPFERGQNTFNAEALLRIICLSEGIWVGKEWCECIIKNTAGDFRQAIQQAHFWAGSVARANILQANRKRYPKEKIQGGNLDIFTNDGISSMKKNNLSLCGCRNINACSYPYFWMYRDYIQNIWLNLEQIVNIGMLLIQNAQTTAKHAERISRTSLPSSKLKEGIHPSLFCNLTAITQSLTKNHSDMQHKMQDRFSPLILESTLENGKSHISNGKLVPISSPRECLQSSHQDKRLTLSCPPLLKCTKKKNNSRVIRCSARKKLVLSNECDRQKEYQSEKSSINVSPSRETSVTEDLLEKVSSSALSEDIKFTCEVLELLSASDALIGGFEKVKSFDLGKNMVFELGRCSNLIHLSVQAALSEKSREMEAKFAKTASTASQCQMIQPLLPARWIMSQKSLTLDLAPHVRDMCRFQAQLIKTGRGRTRQSCRHPTLKHFGPSLREALCSTFLDNKAQ